MLRRTTIIAIAVALAAAACNSDDDGGSPTTDADATTASVRAEPLMILVTNDDGIGAPGIDVLLTALGQMEDVNVQVVAPAANQSGTSDRTTPGGAEYADGQSASGVAGTAVQGFPADTIGVALDELGLDPDLVVSGVNQGQNSGPLAYASGTVGAGREAVRRGIPAIAASAGLGEDADYALAAELVVDFIEDHRAEYSEGDDAPPDVVVNINVPDCTAGTAKDLVEVPLATAIPEGINPFESDCSVADAGVPADDVLAVAAGHPALSLVPPEPAAG